jgi:hypothetical protein
MANIMNLKVFYTQIENTYIYLLCQKILIESAMM